MMINMKKYADHMTTNVHKKKQPKEKAPCKCFSVIILDSVIKANKKYYPQALLEECKNEQKIENLIDDDLEKRESDNDALKMKQNLILIMIKMNMTNNLLKAF